MEYIRVIYFNVDFDMLVEKEDDRYKIDYLTDRVDRGELITMREMAKWCISQGIKFKTHFLYKKDFSLMANLWNFYVYCKICKEIRFFV